MNSGPLWRHENYERRIGNIKEADRLKQIMDANDQKRREDERRTDDSLRRELGEDNREYGPP